MKFNLSFSKQKKLPSIRTKFRVDARRYWVIFLCAFVLALTAELVFFSLAFVRMSDRIEAPATPALETNDLKIKRLQSKLDQVSGAIKARTSQNNSSMVQ